MILSFDIGIKNLAYCFLDKNTIIHGWDVLNIIEQEDESKKCMAFLKNGLVCNKKSSSWTKLPLATDSESDSVGEVRVFYCKRHSTMKTKEGVNLKKIIVKKTKDLTIMELGLRLIETLDNHLKSKIILLQPTEILIELQPSFNPKMKNLSMMLYNYFLIRFFTDYPNNFIRKIKFISAKRKLTVYNGPPVACVLKNKYSRTKFLGTKYCEYMIRHQTVYLDLLKSFKKKDDLSDCFMQGAWYIQRYA
jgi:hypothetical protein